MSKNSPFRTVSYLRRLLVRQSNLSSQSSRASEVPGEGLKVSMHEDLPLAITRKTENDKSFKKSLKTILLPWAITEDLFH